MALIACCASTDVNALRRTDNQYQGLRRTAQSEGSPPWRLFHANAAAIIKPRNLKIHVLPKLLMNSPNRAPALVGFRGHCLFAYTLLFTLASTTIEYDTSVEVAENASYIGMRLFEYSEAAFNCNLALLMDRGGQNVPGRCCPIR